MNHSPRISAKPLQNEGAVEAAGIEPANHSPGSLPDYRVGSRVLVETTTDWEPAYVTGFRSGDMGEDFQRVDVMLDDGRRWRGCHPRHVRKAG